MADDKAKKQAELNKLIQQELDLVEQLNRELAKSAPNEQRIIKLQRQKIALGDKINKQVGMTERGMKKVEAVTGQVVDKGKELAKVFKVEPGWLMFGDSKSSSRTQALTKKLDMLNEEEMNQIEGMVALLIKQRGRANENGNGI